MKDDLGDRQKGYELRESGRRLLPHIPALARIDGRCFHNFTQNMQRPYDLRLSDLMIHTAKWMVQETGARCGYVASDEISLVWQEGSIGSEIFFGGRVQKMVSQLASLASVYFNRWLSYFFMDSESLYDFQPTFDARVWNVPNETEACNYLLWREQDATKNSISMAARHYFSHKEVLNKTGREMQEMLWQQHKVNWNDYPNFFRRGTFIQKRKVVRKYSATEMEVLPLKHEARTNPDLQVERREVVCLDMPKFSSVMNQNDVVFRGQQPILMLLPVTEAGEKTWNKK